MQSATHLVDTEHVQVDEVWMEKGLSPDQVLREEIRLLAIRVLSIDESFHVIEKNLVRATQIKMLPREVLDAVDALVPKWKALSKVHHSDRYFRGNHKNIFSVFVIQSGGLVRSLEELVRPLKVCSLFHSSSQKTDAS